MLVNYSYCWRNINGTAILGNKQFLKKYRYLCSDTYGRFTDNSQIQSQLSCPSTSEWLNCSTHTIEGILLSLKKRNALVTPCNMNPHQRILLSLRKRQSLKVIYYLYHFIKHPQNDTIIEMEKKMNKFQVLGVK